MHFIDGEQIILLLAHKFTLSFIESISQLLLSKHLLLLYLVEALAFLSQFHELLVSNILQKLHLKQTLLVLLMLLTLPFFFQLLLEGDTVLLL
jgi:hypothetical protein